MRRRPKKTTGPQGNHERWKKTKTFAMQGFEQLEKIGFKKIDPNMSKNKI